MKSFYRWKCTLDAFIINWLFGPVWFSHVVINTGSIYSRTKWCCKITDFSHVIKEFSEPLPGLKALISCSTSTQFTPVYVALCCKVHRRCKGDSLRVPGYWKSKLLDCFFPTLEQLLYSLLYSISVDREKRIIVCCSLNWGIYVALKKELDISHRFSE